MRHFHEDIRGQAMVETCLAMALATFAFILITMVSHQMLNRNRTLTAARHAAWLAGNDRRDNMVDLNGENKAMLYLNNVNLWNWFFTPGKDNHTVVTYSSTFKNTLQTISGTTGEVLTSETLTHIKYNMEDLLVKVEVSANGALPDYSHANAQAGGEAKGKVDPGLMTEHAAYISPYRVSYGFGSQSHLNHSPLSDEWPFPLWKLKVPYMDETFLEPFLRFSSVAKWDEVADAWQKPKDAFFAIESILRSALESKWN
jgi:hypothetical protein